MSAAHPPRPRRIGLRPAFTILELLVAVTLTMIVGTIVLAVYSNFLNTYQRTKKELEFLALLRNVTTDMELQINSLVYKAGYWQSLTEYYEGSERPLGPEDLTNINDDGLLIPGAPDPDLGVPAFDYTDPLSTTNGNNKTFYKFLPNQPGGWKFINRGLFQCHFQPQYMGFYYSEQENLIHRVEYWYNPSEALEANGTKSLFKLKNRIDDDGDSPGDTNRDGTVAKNGTSSAEGDEFVDVLDDGSLVIRKTLDRNLRYDDNDDVFDENPRNEGELGTAPTDEHPMNDFDRQVDAAGWFPSGDPGQPIDSNADVAASYKHDDDYSNVFAPPNFACPADKDYGRALFNGVQKLEFSYLYTKRVPAGWDPGADPNPVHDPTGEMRMFASDHWPADTGVKRTVPGGSMDLSNLTPPLAINVHLTILLGKQTKTFALPVIVYGSRWNQMLNEK